MKIQIRIIVDDENYGELTFSDFSTARREINYSLEAIEKELGGE